MHSLKSRINCNAYNLLLQLFDEVGIELFVPAAVQQEANLVHLQNVARWRFIHGAGNGVQFNDRRHFRRVVPAFALIFSSLLAGFSGKITGKTNKISTNSAFLFSESPAVAKLLTFLFASLFASSRHVKCQFCFHDPLVSEGLMSGNSLPSQRHSLLWRENYKIIRSVPWKL